MWHNTEARIMMRTFTHTHSRCYLVYVVEPVTADTELEGRVGVGRLRDRGWVLKPRVVRIIPGQHLQEVG